MTIENTCYNDAAFASHSVFNAISPSQFKWFWCWTTGELEYYYKIILQMNKMIMWLLAILMLVPLNYKYCGKFQSLNPYLHLKCLTMIIFPMLRKRTIVTIQCNTVILLIPVRFLTVLHVATIAYFTRAFTSQILHRKCCI